MVEFGKKFDKFETLEIESISFEERGLYTNAESTSMGWRDQDTISNILINRTPSSDIAKEIKSRLDKIKVEIAPSAHVYQIPSNQKDLSPSIKKTLSTYNYFIVEFGLNVLLGRSYRIPELLLTMRLNGHTTDSTDVVAFDIAPDEKIKEIELIGGKISIGVNNLLKFAPISLGKTLSNFIDIAINPWEFHWKIDKYLIDVFGKLNSEVNWKIYETRTVQGFNPVLILRVRKNVNKITAIANCDYSLKGNWELKPKIKTASSKEIRIWPN